MNANPIKITPQKVFSFVIIVIILITPLVLFTPILGLHLYQYLLTVNNWKIIYLIGLVCSILSPTLVALLLNKSIVQNSPKFSPQKHVPEILVVAIITFFYIILIANNTFKDLRLGLQKKSGGCYVETVFHRRYHEQIIVVNNELTLNISLKKFNELAGNEIGVAKYECNSDIIVFYTENTKQVIDIQYHNEKEQ